MMLILLEHNLDFCSELKKIKERYKPSTISRISSRIEINKLDAFSTPPLLSEGWLLLCDSQLNPAKLKKLASISETNLNLFLVNTTKAKEELASRFHELEIDYYFLNNLKPEKEKVINEIRHEIQIERKAAELLYDKYNGYLPKIVQGIYTLAPINYNTGATIRESDVRKYTAPSMQYSLYDLAVFMLGIRESQGKKRGMDYKDAVKVIKSYKHNVKYIIEYLKVFILQYEEVFNIIESGEYLIEDIAGMKESKYAKEIKKLQNYQVAAIILNYSLLSFDKLLYIKHFIFSLNQNEFAACKLIFLLKTLGGF